MCIISHDEIYIDEGFVFIPKTNEILGIATDMTHSCGENISRIQKISQVTT